MDDHDSIEPLAGSESASFVKQAQQDSEALETLEEFESGDVASLAKYSNGVTKTVFRNGDVLTEFAGGNRRIQYKDGRVVTEFANGNRESESILLNGVIRTVFRAGEVASEVQYPDGSAEMMMRDGTCVAIKANGVTTISRPSGSYETRDRDGRLID